METNSSKAPDDLTEQFYRGVPGIIHDHMHWENGRLVEDTPPVSPEETTPAIE